ncbi:anhydro-N-acetylmuramic acid kinase [Spelaeicoccus albus]|uniref:Anhydro-N-acetylmuramic acid kinase n=1 Tax=Spelaeicoccus albus TaxID=1280376 RepID=A0A7Z0IJ11_9MICO|nr:anhydro-N-acetylmuramic acid kinase [Spelaeicoccus albus]NYI68946.1 anhydro-N-acetylmuramic acid kinase [Spelaeicoccus albus]
MKILGLMSGTSHDGIDAAVVDFTDESATLSGVVLHTSTTPYRADLRERLAAALPPSRTTFAEACALDTMIGQAFAEVAASASLDVGGVDLVCSHGQTVFHWIDDGRARGTLQLGQPAWIADAAGAPVVSDIRAADIVRGGQGAPLVCLLDGMLLGHLPGVSAALNLGGIANMTVVSHGSAVAAYDIGPANALIDAAVAASDSAAGGFDADGALAASGHVDRQLLRVLLDEPFYARRPPKSTGKELFNGDYINRALESAGRTPGIADLVATLTELTVRVSAQAVSAAGADRLVVSGGGVFNPVLMRRLHRALPHVRMSRSDDFGAPAGDKEAILVALIGWFTAHGLPANVPECTGAASRAVLGSITPGPQGFPDFEAADAPSGLLLRASPSRRS